MSPPAFSGLQLAGGVLCQGHISHSASVEKERDGREGRGGGRERERKRERERIEDTEMMM
jgi:hypothetical protein